MRPEPRRRPVYTNISQFHEFAQISQRSSSTVMQAVCRASDTSVAIKCFLKDALSSKEAVHVAREVHLSGTLRDEPGIVQVLGFFEDAEHAYIVMEHCAGRDLYNLLKQRGRLTETHVAGSIMVPLLRTLRHLHDHHRIVHRDIKPENLLLTAGGEVRLADFGMAIQQRVEVPFLPVGTLDYMAPEVMGVAVDRGAVESPCTTPEMLREHGIRPYDERADIWAVGVLAYELVLGQTPFYHSDPEQTRRLILRCQSVLFPLEMANSSFARFVTSAMARDPALRPSAAQLLQHEWLAQHCGSEEPAPMEAADPPQQQTQPFCAHAAEPPPRRRLTGQKHARSENAAALLMDLRAAGKAPEHLDAIFMHTELQEEYNYLHSALLRLKCAATVEAEQRGRGSAPVTGALAKQAQQAAAAAAMAGILPPQHSSDDGSDGASHLRTPSSVLPFRFNGAMKKASRLSRLSRSSSSAAYEVPQERPMPQHPTAEEPGGGESEGTSGSGSGSAGGGGGTDDALPAGQLHRIKSLIGFQRTHWSKKFSIRRTASALVAPAQPADTSAAGVLRPKAASWTPSASSSDNE